MPTVALEAVDLGALRRTHGDGVRVTVEVRLGDGEGARWIPLTNDRVEGVDLHAPRETGLRELTADVAGRAEDEDPSNHSASVPAASTAVNGRLVGPRSPEP
ncbi:MAG: hypothetical protein R3F30_11375 [Planctomycetota bacterium]